MSDLFYRFRFSIALAAALAVSAVAFTAFPTIAGDLERTTGAAAMPGRSGTQNPFVAS